MEKLWSILAKAAFVAGIAAAIVYTYLVAHFARRPDMTVTGFITATTVYGLLVLSAIYYLKRRSGIGQGRVVK